MASCRHLCYDVHPAHAFFRDEPCEIHAVNSFCECDLLLPNGTKELAVPSFLLEPPADDAEPSELDEHSMTIVGEREREGRKQYAVKWDSSLLPAAIVRLHEAEGYHIRWNVGFPIGKKQYRLVEWEPVWTDASKLSCRAIREYRKASVAKSAAKASVAKSAAGCPPKAVVLARTAAHKRARPEADRAAPSAATDASAAPAAGSTSATPIEIDLDVLPIAASLAAAAPSAAAARGAEGPAAPHAARAAELDDGEGEREAQGGGSHGTHSSRPALRLTESEARAAVARAWSRPVVLARTAAHKRARPEADRAAPSAATDASAAPAAGSTSATPIEIDLDVLPIAASLAAAAPSAAAARGAEGPAAPHAARAAELDDGEGEREAQGGGSHGTHSSRPALRLTESEARAAVARAWSRPELVGMPPLNLAGGPKNDPNDWSFARSAPSALFSCPLCLLGGFRGKLACMEHAKQCTRVLQIEVRARSLTPTRACRLPPDALVARARLASRRAAGGEAGREAGWRHVASRQARRGVLPRHGRRDRREAARRRQEDCGVRRRAVSRQRDSNSRRLWTTTGRERSYCSSR